MCDRFDRDLISQFQGGFGMMREPGIILEFLDYYWNSWITTGILGLLQLNVSSSQDN